MSNSFTCVQSKLPDMHVQVCTVWITIFARWLCLPSTNSTTAVPRQKSLIFCVYFELRLLELCNHIYQHRNYTSHTHTDSDHCCSVILCFGDGYGYVLCGYIGQVRLFVCGFTVECKCTLRVLLRLFSLDSRCRLKSPTNA